MPLRKDITGIILAGGKSSRMGTDKALMQFQGEKLIERTMRTFRSVFPKIMIITNTPLDYLDQDAGIATDIFPGKGPLGGIYTGLFFSPSRVRVRRGLRPAFLQPGIHFLHDRPNRPLRYRCPADRKGPGTPPCDIFEKVRGQDTCPPWGKQAEDHWLLQEFQDALYPFRGVQ